MDVIDRLLDGLNAIEGLEFYRDARTENAPDVNYGVVRLTGEVSGSWADGHLVDQAFGLSVTVYVKDERTDWLTRVQETLDAFDLGYRMPSRNYIYDIDAVEWEWSAAIYGPLEEAESDGEDDV